jgi:hypothetical protein
MVDPLSAACKREFERVVHAAFKDWQRRGHPYDDVPFIGEPHYTHGGAFTDLQQQVRAALLARERFRLDAPSWAPTLPLRTEDCMAMQQSFINRIKLVGIYAITWRNVEWREQHPQFADFCRGAFGGPLLPACLERDAALKAEFPPEFSPEVNRLLSACRLQ